MSQLPETPAAGWSEQDYDPSAYGRPEEVPPAQGAVPQQAAPEQPAAPQYGQAQTGWQQDTEPDWGASQQGYPGPSDYGAQSGYAGQGQAGYAAQPGYGAGPAEQAMMMQDSGSGLPTEFDHLFRDSTPDSRRAIDRQKPMIGGAAPGYLQGAQQQQQQPAEAAPVAENPGAEQLAAPQGAPYQQYPQQQGFPQAEQYENAQYQGAGYPNGQYQDPQYQAAQFQGGQYGQPAGYPQDQMGYGGPGGYDDGSGYGGPGGGGGLRNRKGLIIGGAVAVVAVIGIIVAVTSNSSSGKPQAGSGTPTAVASKASPKQQADQIYQLIQQSGQLRSDANTGVVEVNACKNLADAQTLLSDTAQKRQAQADSVAKIDVSGIANGTELVNQLKAAWTASAQYDSAYAQIAGDLQGNCKTSAVKKDPNYKTSNEQAVAADNAKAQAAQLWNANVATPLGESQITEGRL
ncbi:MAG TPA: hypothetical protein VFA06_07295 [Actinocrinis sp.]|uniref:hypothetical protein n=1 Tax=Actinocrinis sp. TaxID=1920516 RepID=UPI002D3CD304|nr:hypothetical protein [Actinocrinis sp.]HZU55658.1 hypothetical protein [Actinocrinis sp.]